MLSDAGVAQHNPAFAELFSVERVHDTMMPYLYLVLDLEADMPASQALLLGIARRGMPDSYQKREWADPRKLSVTGIRWNVPCGNQRLILKLRPLGQQGDFAF